MEGPLTSYGQSFAWLKSLVVVCVYVRNYITVSYVGYDIQRTMHTGVAGMYFTKRSYVKGKPQPGFYVAV